MILRSFVWCYESYEYLMHLLLAAEKHEVAHSVYVAIS